MKKFKDDSAMGYRLLYPLSSEQVGSRVPSFISVGYIYTPEAMVRARITTLLCARG